MKSSLSNIKRVGLACVAFGAIAVSQQSLAAGTAANTTIDNRATVSFQVGGVAQTPIESSPTGNSTAGVGNGASTTFLVDNRVDLTVTEVGGAATTTGAGAANVVTTFRVTNTGNNPQGYNLSSANLASGNVLFTRTDAFDMTNLRTFVSTAACSGVSPTPAYNSGTDMAVNIATLAADACAYVFIVSDTPVTAANGQAANVSLTAVARVATTLAALTQTAGAESPTVVDIVFADGGRDATELASDQYFVQTAALSVGKTSTVISDPFNSTTNPKSIPGAIVEYGITLTNTGAVSATVVTITDPVPTNTTFANGVYNAGASNVSVTVGATTTFCQAEAGGTDTNADGCFRTAGGVLTVGSPALTTIATGAGNAVTVRFRVTIN
jgi:uncharacterized repeat protein (TIGR01451 family)